MRKLINFSIAALVVWSFSMVLSQPAQAKCSLTKPQRVYCSAMWGDLPRKEMKRRCWDMFCEGAPPPPPIERDVFPGTERRFAPSIIVAGAGNNSVQDYERMWDKWAEPFYEAWLDKRERTRMGIYHAAFALKNFYNHEPSDYSNPNDSGYNWSKFDAMLDMAPIREGKAKFHWMIDVEGSTIPQWMVSSGLVHLGPGSRKEVIDFQKEQLVQAMMGFWDAYGKRYDNDDRVYTVFVDEDNAKGGVNESLWQNNKKRVYLHMDKAIKKQSIILTFNPKIIEDVVSVSEVGPGVSDIKMFLGPCGSKGNAPTVDCSSPPHKAMQKYNRTRPTAALSISNGFKIVGRRQGYSSAVSNPWGEPLPTPREPPKNPDTNVTPAVYVWYVSGAPRASDGDSRLGQPGRDAAGITPSHFVCITTSGKRHKGYTPEEWDRALRIFGAQGTKAVPALPPGW